MASRRGPDNSVRIAIAGTYGAQNWANIFHAQLATSSAITQADLDTWTTAFQAAYKTRIGALLSTGVAYSTAKAICYTPGNTELISSIVMTGTGAAAGAVVQDNSVSVVLSWNSSVYWRGGKPRTYVNGVLAGSLASNTAITGGAQTTYQTAGTNLRNDINALTAGTITGTQFGFLSFSSGNVARSPALFFAITGCRVHPRLGTQRRRMGKWLN